MKNIFLLLFFLTFSVIVFGQKFTTYTLAKVGYTNINGNYGQLGAEIFLVDSNDNILNFSATANLGAMSTKFLIIPEGEIAYLFKGKNGKPYSEDFKSAFYKVGVAANPHAIYPNVGIALLSIIEINAGYSFQFSENDYTSFDGIRFGLQLHIPTQVFGN